MIAGRLPSKKPLSLITARSAARRSRLASSQASRWIELDSSSPSKTNLRLTGRPPRVARIASVAPQMDVDLALVVGRAPADHPVALDERLERRRLPQLDRIDRLHVVVAVDDDRRGVGRVEPIAVDDRMAAGLATPRRSRRPSRGAGRRPSRPPGDSRPRTRAGPEMLGIRRNSRYDAIRRSAVEAR